MATMNTSKSPPTKKAKLEPEGELANGGKGSNHSENDTDEHNLEELAETAWEHYRNYIDSCEANEAGEGDTDELEEMIKEVLEPHFSDIQPLQSLKDAQMATCQLTALLPVLISVAYYHLADCAISECLEVQERKDDKKYNQEKQMLLKQCQSLMEKCLHWYPENAAMWSMGANFGRMFQIISPTSVCQWYERAVECSHQVRTVAMEILEDETSLPLVKEWTESLLLNHVVGVEYVVDNDNDDDDDDGEVGSEVKDTKMNKETRGTKGKDKDKDEEEDEMDEEDLENSKDGEDEGHFSSSAVEATARFMAAMLHSTAGRHDLGLEHLRHFPITHRLRPNVWQPKDSSETASKHLIRYQGRTDNDGVLPPDVYKRLCQVFAPGAAFWNESDYNHRGYYSFYMDIPSAVKDCSETVRGKYAAPNVIEDVIWNHLYPLVQEQMKNRKDLENSETTICGAEWWVHTRPIEANLGHNLHFDTDEALLTQEGVITHPIYSSVLYLTGGAPDAGGGGATVVLDQTPDSQNVATQAWRCVPQDNSYMVFPGEMLHGVLPCPGPESDWHKTSNDYQAAFSKGKDEDAADLVRKHWTPKESSPDKMSRSHRLTFLVGFWTRRVPDKMKQRKLYGPCGPMPSCSSGEGGDKDEQKHTWADEIAEGYDISRQKDTNGDNKGDIRSDLRATPLPVISPAWETLKIFSGRDDEAAWLQLPKAIDHRFFVNGAPKCFRDSLFERSVDDEINC